MAAVAKMPNTSAGREGDTPAFRKRFPNWKEKLEKLRSTLNRRNERERIRSVCIETKREREPELNKMTIKQIRKLAAEKGLRLPSSMRKTDLIMDVIRFELIQEKDIGRWNINFEETKDDSKDESDYETDDISDASTFSEIEDKDIEPLKWTNTESKDKFYESDEDVEDVAPGICMVCKKQKVVSHLRLSGHNICRRCMEKGKMAIGCCFCYDRIRRDAFWTAKEKKARWCARP